MADFREELHIERCTDKFGKPSWFPLYSWCHTKTDLADDTVQIIDFGEKGSLADMCKLICEVEATELAAKLGIREFLKNDRYYNIYEY